MESGESRPTVLEDKGDEMGVVWRGEGTQAGQGGSNGVHNGRGRDEVK